MEILFLLALSFGFPAPDHCYDFTSQTVSDGCGSVDLI